MTKIRPMKRDVTACVDDVVVEVESLASGHRFMRG